MSYSWWHINNVIVIMMIMIILMMSFLTLDYNEDDWDDVKTLEAKLTRATLGTHLFPPPPLPSGQNHIASRYKRTIMMKITPHMRIWPRAEQSGDFHSGPMRKLLWGRLLLLPLRAHQTFSDCMYISSDINISIDGITLSKFL